MKTSYRVLILAVIVAASFGAGALAGQGRVEKKGQDSKVLLERVVSGHLTELNGKYRLRLTEVTYEPGGFIGTHHHAGPGFRYVLSGTLTYVENGKTTNFGPGTYFYESGDVAHTGRNDGKEPVHLLNFEILPVNWKGSSAIPVPR